MSSFVPHAQRVEAPGGLARRWILVLHGILGSGSNFRTFARRLVAARPELGFVLVDLRAHGASLDPPPPHTLAEAARDLARLEASPELAGRDVSGVLGHSFGGKVALAHAAARREAGRPLDVCVVLDSSPSARPARQAEGDLASALGRDQAAWVLGWLEGLPWPLESRERFFELAEGAGLSRGIAEWLAMNVRRAGDLASAGVVHRVDLGLVRLLLDDYFSNDYWHLLEGEPVARRLAFVAGGRSTALSRAELERLRRLAARPTERGPALTLEVLPEAGHWVHVDDPDGLFRVLVSYL
jgi:esterase